MSDEFFMGMMFGIFIVPIIRRMIERLLEGPRITQKDHE